MVGECEAHRIPSEAANLCPSSVQPRWPGALEKAGKDAYRTQAETLGRTGVEMEALTAVQVGLLTIYDMVKAIARGMVMGDIRVLEKHGGKSGNWAAP